MSMGTMTVGVSASGMENYREELKSVVLIDTSTLIDDVSGIESALNAGWQGASKDAFLQKFAQHREALKGELAAEYQDLENRLEELQSFFFNQDQKMIDMEGF
jgi:uncharacterized protein YukE